MAIEPISAALTVLGGKLAYDVLGPTAKYLGEQSKGLTEAGVENIRRVFANAKQKIEVLELEGGSVPPRLLPPIMQSAYFCEDEVVASYLGGILCSARTPNGRDDRSVSVLNSINGLSSYALKAHSIVYSSIFINQRDLPNGFERWMISEHGTTATFMEEKFYEKMDFTEDEDKDSILEHSFISLSAQDLCTKGIHPRDYKNDVGPFRFLHPTIRGIELFCWGNGSGRNGISSFFSDMPLSEELAKMAISPIRMDLGKVNY